jgi:hypothetical protein
LNVVFLFQVPFEGLALLSKHSRAHLAQKLVAVRAVRQMRIVSQLDVDSMLVGQMFGYLSIGITQKAFAIFTVRRHGTW